MVLQRESEVAIWGWASPDEAVRVSGSWMNTPVTTSADAKGNWRVRLPTPQAGGPYTLTIAGHNSITLEDVLIGEVWLCSGQSNMEWPLAGVDSDDARAAIPQADDAELRLFNVPNTVSLTPRIDCAGRWERSTPETASRFSATAYFFGRALRRELGVPIGLVEADWGGTRAEAWMSAEALNALPELADQLAFVRAAAQGPNERARLQRELTARWWDRLDDGADVGRDWFAPGRKPDWEAMTLPAHFGPEGLDQFDGVVYFRRDIELPDGWQGKPVTLSLGPIDDFDDVWFNGVHVGGIHDDGQWNTPRRYEVPGQAVLGGTNTIAIRVVDQAGPGGVFGDPGQLYVQRDDMRISIAGPWMYHRGKAISDLPQRGSFSVHENTATALYNGMIEPVRPFTIRGVIWYQGESNVDTWKLYRRVFPGLIQSWRDAWGLGDFPFYFVQIAPFRYGGDDVRPPLLREAQNYALQLPNTGVVVTTDIGDAVNIHPMKKVAVGERLAAWALARDYGRADVVCCGPMLKDATIEGSRIRVRFDHTHGGLIARGGDPDHFQIAGADRRFVPAHARIEGDQVVVWSEAVAKPVAVRFGWSAAPEPNLFNAAGLPACPFRTDDWD
ncbi:MAG: sialate O-acetylesterase [Phycisphaerales bacterium]